MDFNSYILNLNDANCYIKGGKYHFYIRDHLGNNRVVIQVIIEDGEEGIKEGVGIEGGTVVQRNDYYPSGLPMTNMLSPDEQQFKYNGKEFDTMHGVNMYDYGARMFDPAIMRWGVIDPSAERYFHFTPYAYVTNNPLKYTDPDGCDRRLEWGNNTVTIHATFYYFDYKYRHDSQYSTAFNAFWGGLKILNESTDYTYTDEAGKTWKVKFKLIAKNSTNPENSAKYDKEGNSFTIVDGKLYVGDEEAEGTASRENIKVIKKASALTVAQEMVHVLGERGHSESGLMVKYVNHPKRSDKLLQENINAIIRTNMGIEEMVKVVINELEKAKSQFELPPLPPNMRDKSMSAFHEIMYRMYLQIRSPEIQNKDF